jgi:hypothetical protein
MHWVDETKLPFDSGSELDPEANLYLGWGKGGVQLGPFQWNLIGSHQKKNIFSNLYCFELFVMTKFCRWVQLSTFLGQYAWSQKQKGNWIVYWKLTLVLIFGGGSFVLVQPK